MLCGDDRTMIDPGLRSIVVRDDGLVGTLLLPAGPPPHPVVIAVGGSAPGIFALPALRLAAHGIATLALAYFGMEHLPQELTRIPLEYFGRAIRWLASREELRPGAVGIAGGSRGGELALLIAATYSEIKAVAAGRRVACSTLAFLETPRPPSPRGATADRTCRSPVSNPLPSIGNRSRFA